MSEIDRIRYDKHRRLLKQGVLPGQTCTCDLKVAQKPQSRSSKEESAAGKLEQPLETTEQRPIQIPSKI